MTIKSHVPKSSTEILIFAGTLVFLYVISVYNYLLFHSLVEMFSIIIGCGIFIIAWNAERFMDNAYMLFMGIACLFVAGLDGVHALSYKGMGIFQGGGANLPTQLWVGARYLESLSFLAALVLMGRQWRAKTLFSIYLTVFLTFLAVLFFTSLFPACYIEGEGLTAFKKISEYLICTILLMTLYLMFQRREQFDKRVHRLLMASIITTILSELSFTFYISVYGFSNLTGHLFKVVSFYLVYKAIIEFCLVRPYDAMFRNLKKNRDELADREKELRRVLDDLRVLRGIIPICSHCKKIRDDQGAWNRLEAYIQEHSMAQFSHGICPECAKKVWGETLEE